MDRDQKSAMRFLFLCEYGYAFAMLYSRLKEGDQVQTDDIQTSVRDLYDGASQRMSHVSFNLN